MALLTDEIRAWIGREVTYTAPEELGRASIRYFALAVGDDNRLYTDEEYARAAGYPSVIAPPTLVVETCQYAHRRPADDGYIGHEWPLPIARCRLIRAGNEYEFFQPVLPADRLSVTWRLEDIAERPSSRGGTQLFVTSIATFVNQRGEPLALNRETVVLQPLAPTPPGSEERRRGGGPESRPAAREEATPAPTLAAGLPAVGCRVPPLERALTAATMAAYGGATWDWHRLHYDAEYARARQLPGPVVDGQMFGALLAEMLLDWLGPRAFIRRLAFRMKGMVFAGETVRGDGEVTATRPAGDHDAIEVAQRIAVGDRVAAEGNAEVRLPRSA